MLVARENQFQRRMAQLNEYREWAALAQQQTGKSLLTQLWEIRAMRSMGGQCGAADYFGYKLYDDSYLEGRGRADFLGWRLLEEFSLALNPRYAVLPAWDKVVFTQIATDAGLPVAPVLACFHSAPKISIAMGVHLKTVEQVASFLRNPLIYPLFGKPAFSQQGYGSAFFKNFHPQTDQIELIGGQLLSVSEFLTRLSNPVDHRYHKPECGYIFQKPLKLASEIEAITEWPAICGVRVVCLNGADGVVPIRAVWKVAMPPNHIDNFSMGKYGNLVANVDLATGSVGKLIGGLWPNTSAMNNHPLSGKEVQNFKLPGWATLLDTCKRGGAVFSLMKIHHWDFALTDQGPLILELNDIGSIALPQLHGCGLLTEYTRDFLKRNANVGAYPWIRQL